VLSIARDISEMILDAAETVLSYLALIGLFMEQIPRTIERKRWNGITNCMMKEQKIFKQRWWWKNN